MAFHQVSQVKKKNNTKGEKSMFSLLHGTVSRSQH